jgi:diketogulonate reductase-like aldo/keto reductase
MKGGKLLADPVLEEIAHRYKRSVAQIVLRWEVQRGVVTIPKTVKTERLAENSSIFDFALDDADVAAINALDRNDRAGTDPFNFGF